MKYMHSEWRDRVAHWKDALLKDLYLPLGEIPMEGRPAQSFLTPEEALRGDFVSMPPGTAWGRSFEYCWLRGELTLPAEAAGRRIAMDLRCGGEATVFVDGLPFGTYRKGWVNTPHHFIVDNTLSLSARPGERHRILLEVYAGHFFPESPRGGCATGPVRPGDYQDTAEEGRRTVFQGCSYGIWNEEAYQLLLDVTTLEQLLENTDPESLRADRLAEALERFTLVADFEQPLSGREQSYREARAVLRPVLAARNGDTAPRFYAIGNAHLDLAWLWPLQETVRKTARTFAAQLRLLAEYPDYRFLQSQPAAYALCREHYPDLYRRVLEAIREGRWLAEGAMWVEPDTNMPSGEALIRQLLHGKRFFKEELGVDSEVLWLPDSFGYSAALPQILRGCGVKRLVTQKIFWSYNEGDGFPYHYFSWQGADGSAVDTFLPTSYTYRTDPEGLCGTWKKRRQKRGLEAFLFPFGYGDGGGGPCRDHVEYALRARDLEGVPRVRFAGPNEFFRDLEDAGGPRHSWRGELYFSAHRGVFTSQAAVKKGNRRAEAALREAEFLGSLALIRGVSYPYARMDASWKLLLFNQFHDILPGSSIARVNQEARQDLARVREEAGAVASAAAGALFSGPGLSVVNTLSFERQEVVALPEAFSRGARGAQGEPVPVLSTGEGAFALVRVPACGALALYPAQIAPPPPACTARLTRDGAVLENDRIRVRLNPLGEVESLTDLQSGREHAAGALNRFRLYKDVPRLFDAWDIDSNYSLQELPLKQEAELSVAEAGGLRAAVRLCRVLGNSSLEQRIVLRAGSPRLDFETSVDWNELHRLLKVDFPLAAQAEEALNEIQFGYIRRPAHRSRPYDQERFEVCQHRWTALCDEGHGAAVLNDCKYGISQLGNTLSLTLLRAPASPEMGADRGRHRFTYAALGWDGPLLQSPVLKEAWSLNAPFKTFGGTGLQGSVFSLDAPNVFIDTLKPAEDQSGDLILRLYEGFRAQTDCTLRLNLTVREVREASMMEEDRGRLPLNGSELPLRFRPFEVKTLRLLGCAP